MIRCTIRDFLFFLLIVSSLRAQEKLTFERVHFYKEKELEEYKATLSIKYLLTFPKSHPCYSWVDAKMKEIAGLSSNKPWDIALDDMAKSMLEWGSNKNEEESLSYMQNLSNALRVVFNEKDFLIIRNLYSQYYYGAANYYYGYLFSILDLKNKKKLGLRDIFIEQAPLEQIIVIYFKRKYGIAKLRYVMRFLSGKHSFLEDERIQVSQCFHFNNLGITFVYNIYEIASRADGPLHVFIPFYKIDKYLKREFKDRIFSF